MTLTTKTRIAKRKLEIKEVRKENQKDTSKKHDRKCFEFSERSTKDVLLKHLRVLEDKISMLDEEKKASEDIIDKLKTENHKQNETNTCLKEQITELKNKVNSQPNVVKTDTGDILMLCNECEYPAEDIFDLGEHMFEIHSSRYDAEAEDGFTCDICADRFMNNLDLNGHNQKHHRDSGCKDSIQSCDFCAESFPSEDILTEHITKNHMNEAISSDPPKSFACKFCEEAFEISSELMKHKKRLHTEHVSICWNFDEGLCPYEDSLCWFIHEKADANIQKFNSKCNICDIAFKTRPEHLKHRKLIHLDLVPVCKNIKEGTCHYGETKCWFKHNIEEYHTKDEKEDESLEYNEVVKKLFNIVEKVTERLAKLENINTV